MERAGAPKGAGLYHADLATIARIHRELLFKAKVEACDGNNAIKVSWPAWLIAASSEAAPLLAVIPV